MIKRVLFLLSALIWAMSAVCADVSVTLSGLQSEATATLTISSYEYLSTIEAKENGNYVFKDVPAGTHYVKAEADGYTALPSQAVIVGESGSVIPTQAIRLVLTPMSGNADEWTFSWAEDGSPAGQTLRSHVNEPVEIDFLGKKIVPADVPSFELLAKDYNIYLTDGNLKWTQEYAYRILETLKTIPAGFGGMKPASFRLTDRHIERDIEVTDLGEGCEVEISKDAFYYANPFLVDLDGVRGRLFSKRLHHALVNYATDFGQDTKRAASILRDRFGCEIMNVDYENLTKGITDETAAHFQQFLPTELVSIINMLEELPEGFHVTPHLNYLIRRINGMPHPIYPEFAAVTWAVDNGYIEFMENSFGGNNLDFETLRLILHEKTHFLWAYTFPEELKKDWIELGGWYENPNAADGWSTTKNTEFVSAYAHAHNPNEDMAESVAFYLKNPDMLMLRSPEKYEFICNRVMHGTRYISKVPDHLTFEVLNLSPDYDYPGKIKRLSVVSAGAPEEDKVVTVEIELNDEEGYDDDASSAIVRLYSPEFICSDGTTGSQFADLWMYPVDGNGHLLRGSVTISKYSKSGHWTAGDIKVNDMQGNQRFEGRNDCVFDLYVNNPLEDITPPQYNGDLRYILTPKEIDGHEAQNLQVRFKISDNVGFKRVLVRLQLPGSTYSQDYDGYYEEETGEGVVDIPITEYFPEGDYYLRLVSLDDKAGNNIWHVFSDDSNDSPIQYVHITTANPDTQNPEVDLDRITVYAEPTKPEAPDGETLVTISFYARDDKSGLGTVNYRLRDPQGIDHFEYFYHRNFYSLYFNGDPTVWEHYLIKVVLPKGSAPGIWGLAQMTVADKAFNQLTYDFVETLIFEPDDNESDYELFADIDEEMVTFDVNSSAENAYSYSWRLIHEDSGLELAGNSKDVASRAISASSHIDVSNMPGGDLILIVKVHDEGGTVQSVKTKRLSYLKAVKKIALESVIMELTEGETGTLKATITPTDATDKAIAWSSSAPEVASVTEEGVVTALKAGTATITASTANGLTATCEVTVVAATVDASGLELNLEEAEIVEGESVQLQAMVLPADATDKTVTWTSSDAAVATVNASGLVTALKPGKATITASTANGLKATCEVTVVAATVDASGLELNLEEAEIVEGESVQLQATVLPADASDKTVTWTSSDAAVTTVNASGVVAALKVGTATITASTANGLTATCTVTVTAKPSGIENVDGDGVSAVRVEGGEIVISGDAVADVFSLTGSRVAIANGGRVSGLPRGIYLVRTGGKTFKIVL